MFVVLHPHELSVLSGYDDGHLQELLLSPFLCLILASAHRVWPLPESESECLGSAPSVLCVEAPPAGGASSKKRRFPLRFFV